MHDMTSKPLPATKRTGEGETALRAQALIETRRPPLQRRRSLLRGLLPMASAILCLSALQLTAVIPAPEKLLPDDTLFMVTVPDCAKMRALWKNCPQAQLWNDPVMKPFRDKFQAKVNEEFLEPLERDLGVRFNDYAGLPQGQATFALIQNGWKGSDNPPPALLVLLDTKDKKDQLKQILAELRKKWVDAGKSIRTEKIRGVDFSIVPVSGDTFPKTVKAMGNSDTDATSGDDAKGGPGKDLVVGQYDSLLIIGNSIGPVEKVMVHLTGGAMPALGDLAAFEANRLALFRDAPGYAWANMKSILGVMGRSSTESDTDSEDPIPAPDPGKFMTALGLGSLQTLACSFQNTADGSFVQVFAGAREANREGFLKLLPVRGKESGPPPFIPADVVKFQRCRIDGQKAWATMQEVMNAINPQLLKGLSFVLDTAESAAKQKDPDFNINRNLFGNLGDDLIIYSKAPRGQSPLEISSSSSLVLLSSPQPEQLAGALKTLGVLWSPQGGPPAEREFLGRKIFSLALPGLPLPGADVSRAGARTLNCAATGGYVAMSTDASLLEEYLRSSDSQQRTLRDKPGLIAAAAKVGGMGTGWFGYENQAETSRILIEQLRKISAALAGTTNAAADGPPPFSNPRTAFKDWLDFSLLPPFDKISKYFYFSVYSAGANADGLTFNWFAPTPPGLKK